MGTVGVCGLSHARHDSRRQSLAFARSIVPLSVSRDPNDPSDAVDHPRRSLARVTRIKNHRHTHPYDSASLPRASSFASSRANPLSLDLEDSRPCPRPSRDRLALDSAPFAPCLDLPCALPIARGRRERGRDAGVCGARARCFVECSRFTSHDSRIKRLELERRALGARAAIARRPAPTPARAVEARRPRLFERSVSDASRGAAVRERAGGAIGTNGAIGERADVDSHSSARERGRGRGGEDGDAE